MSLIQNFTNPPPQAKREPVNLNLSASGNLLVRISKRGAVHLRVKASGDITGRAKFAISIPAPILNEVSPDAFPPSFLFAELTDNFGNRIDFSSAQLDAPRDQVGSRFSFEISKKDVSVISVEKTYTFKIGVKQTLSSETVWHTVLDSAPISGRNYRVAFKNDSLSFTVIEPLKNKMNKYPLKNYIFYNPLRTEVKLSEIDKVFDQSGNYVRTEVRALPNLTLYKILDFYKGFCGFSNIVTDVPNYEITRFDLNIETSYLDSLKGVLGAFSPLIYVNGTTLYLLDRTKEVPFDFNPGAVTADSFNEATWQITEDANFDGYQVSFVDSDSLADYYSDRLVQSREETGTFGNADYTRTDINRTYRDWFFNEQPENPVRTELVREVHSTYNSTLDLIGRESNDHVYDAQGKRTNSARTVESKVPNLAASGELALLTVREENQSIFYESDARNSRRQFQSKTITQMSGIISIDAENQYFEQDFKQDFLEAHKAGNLTAEMTSEFGLLKTITETLTPLGNNQFEVRTSTVDHLRGATTNGISEPKTGDASLNSLGGRQRQTIVLREGLTLTNRTGGKIEGFNLGEIPLQIGIPLVESIIDRRASRKQDGSISIAGFDESIERGTFFRVFDRSNVSYGIFLTEGYRLDIRALGNGVSIATTAEVSEI